MSTEETETVRRDRDIQKRQGLREERRKRGEMRKPKNRKNPMMGREQWIPLKRGRALLFLLH